MNFAELDRLLEDLGHTSDTEKARFLGVSRTTYQRQRRQEHHPSPRFMSAVQSRYPGLVELASHPTGPAGPRPTGPAGPRPKEQEAGAA